MKILIAVDDRDLLTCCKEYFESAGHDVTAVFDGASAVDQASSAEFDIAIIDSGLKITGSSKVVRILISSDIPVILLSDKPDSVESLSDDPLPCSYLQYPFTLRELSGRIYAVLDKAGRETVPKGDCDAVRIRGFTIDNAVRITNEEIEFLISDDSKNMNDSYIYAESLNAKLAASGKRARIIYKLNEGYRLVAYDE